VPYVRTSVVGISYYAALAPLLNAVDLDTKSGIRGPKTIGEAHNSLSLFTLAFVHQERSAVGNRDGYY
jgi:hypothetical protein